MAQNQRNHKSRDEGVSQNQEHKLVHIVFSWVESQCFRNKLNTYYIIVMGPPLVRSDSGKSAIGLVLK